MHKLYSPSLLHVSSSLVSTTGHPQLLTPFDAIAAEADDVSFSHNSQHPYKRVALYEDFKRPQSLALLSFAEFEKHERMAPNTGSTPPPSKLDRPSSHCRHSSSKSLSLLLNGSFRSPSASPPPSASSYQPCPVSPMTPIRSFGDSKSSITSSSPTLQVIPSNVRRASDGCVHPSSIKAESSTSTNPSLTSGKENRQTTPSTVQSFTARVQRSCSTSALSSLSLLSTASPRTRQISGKAAIALPALDCTNSEKGDLATRSRSASASPSVLNELVTPGSSSSSSSTASCYFPSPNTPMKAPATLTSMLMTSLTPSPWQHTYEDVQEELSPSSLSSHSSSESPATPTSAPNTSRLPSPLQRAASYSYAWCNNNNKDKLEPESKENVQNTKQYPSHYSPPPKRSRANTVNPCSKSSAALRSITEKPREGGSSANTATPPRQTMSSSALRSVPSSSSTMGKREGLAAPNSPRSPRSPLSQHALQAYFDPCSLPTPSPPSSCSETEDHACIVKQSSSFGTLLLPSTISNASSDLAVSSIPSTPLTPSHTIYIDHIAVSYNPSTTSGQECKKLLMRLERFKKRSSLDLGKLSSEQTSQILYASKNGALSDSATEGTRRKSSTSKDGTSINILRSASADSSISTGTTSNGSGNCSSRGVAGHAGNGQTFRVTAKIRENHEPNRIEVVYVDGFKLTIDATGLSHIDMLGLHAHVMAKRNAASSEVIYHASSNN